MISTTPKYKQEIISGNRNYVVKANVTLADNTAIVLTNTELWDQGVVLENAISSDNNFDIGSAIIGSLTLIIDNISGRYNFYDFANAKIVLWMGIENDVDSSDNQVYYRLGFYSVDDTSYNGSLITLNCLDNMTWFDVPFNEITGLTYPTTAGALVAAMCSHVGVTLGTVTFPNYTTAITSESGEWLAKNKINCREVLQYIAQKCCCYCKINTAGELVLRWYDKDEINNIANSDGGSFYTTTTPYSDGCDLDGGTFDPWSSGDIADGGTFLDLQSGAWLTRNFEMNVSTEGIVITGCCIRSTSGQDQYEELWVDSTLELTHDRYVLVIENNPLIVQSEAAAIANIVGSTLANLPLRAFTSRSLSDMSYETGDMVTILDFRGNIYYTWITSLTFNMNNSENFGCGAQSLKKRNETRFSSTAKTLAEASENASAILSDYDRAQAAMNELAQNALDYNVYEYSVTGVGKVTWLYNGTTVDTTTYSAEKPLFPDSSNVIEISGDGLFISHDHGENYFEGLDANSGTAILNMIFAHGITCDWIKAGTLTLGGDNNVNGSLRILNASGTQIGKWDKDGISASNGTFSGSLSGATGSFSGSISSSSMSSSSISGTSFTSESSQGGRTYISGGQVDITTAADAWLSIRGGETVTFGELISVNGDIYVQYRPTYFGWALYDAHSAHSSDKKLKKKIKDIPIKNSRDVILGARPRYYEFKKTNEGGVRSGFVAQELREALDKVGDTTAIERESVRREGEREIIYEDFIAHLVNTTQDLYKRIEKQEQEIALLKEKVGE